MKILKFTALLLVANFVVIANPCIADVVVIVHPGNSATLDDVTIKKIFLGKIRKFPGGGEAIPINQAEGSAPRSEFERKVLNKTSAQLMAYWSKLVFTGKGTPPKDVSSGAEVKSLISSNPNLMGYIDASLVDGSVKVVKTL